MGAGLNSSMARMRDRATSDLKTDTTHLQYCLGAIEVTLKGHTEWGYSPLPTTELCEVLLPGVTQGHFELEALQDTAALRRSQLCCGSWQQGGEDGAKVLVYLQWEIMGNKLIILKLNKKGTTKSQYLKFHNYRILRNKQRKLQQDRKEAMIYVSYGGRKRNYVTPVKQAANLLSS